MFNVNINKNTIVGWNKTLNLRAIVIWKNMHATKITITEPNFDLYGRKSSIEEISIEYSINEIFEG